MPSLVWTELHRAAVSTEVCGAGEPGHTLNPKSGMCLRVSSARHLDDGVFVWISFKAQAPPKQGTPRGGFLGPNRKSCG